MMRVLGVIAVFALFESTHALAHGQTNSGATMASATTASNATYHVVLGGYPSGPKAWDYADVGIKDWTDAAPMILWIFTASAVFFPLIYTFMRTASNGALKKLTAGNTNAKSRYSEGMTTMVGLKDNGYGTFCYYIVSSVYLFLLMWYLTILIDTYWGCQLTGPDNLCFYGARPIYGRVGKVAKKANQEIFFAWWFVTLCWNLVNFLVGKYIRNFFRTECVFNEATHVYVVVKNKKNVMVNTNKVVEIARGIAKNLVGEDDFTYHRITVPIIEQKSTNSIDVLCRRYTYSEKSCVFEPATQALPADYATLSALPGLSTEVVNQRITKLGENNIPYKVSPWMTLIQDELNSYLYLYQFTIYSMWLWFSALTWGSPQVVVVLGAAVVSVTLTRYNQEIIQKITQYSTKCEVQRDNKWVTIDSPKLVPGDKVRLSKRNWILPCDLVMVKGTCITDESGLTGESMPVRKVELPGNAGVYEAEKDTKHTLYAGTTVLQAGAGEGDINTHAIVTETGIRTAKGELISHILFPADMVFQYDEELRVVFMFLMIYAFILFGISVWLQIQIAPLTWVPIFAFALFTISQILPPLLPIALVVGHTMSAKRLKEKQVLCVNPKRIAISGKIHVFCFDKTGTLTKQGLDFLGVRTTNAATFAPEVKNAKSVSGDVMGIALATCHAVTTMGGSGPVGFDDAEKTLDGMTTTAGGKQLVGNQVEVKMFQASGYELVEDGGNAPKVRSPSGETLTIEKRFEFDHHTMTMSVLVRDTKGDVHVFCKGAPEKIGELANPASLSEDFSSVHQGHAMLGCYVIGVSHRVLGNIPADELAKMPRADVEKTGTLDLIGLLLFRNQLKDDTADAIEALQAGDVRTVMVTGDNAQCGLYIAKEAKFIAADRTVYVAELEEFSTPKSTSGKALTVDNTVSTTDDRHTHGLGMLIDSSLTVTLVAEGGQAIAGGVKVGDVITKMGDVDFNSGQTDVEAVAALTSAKENSADLVVEFNGGIPKPVKLQAPRVVWNEMGVAGTKSVSTADVLALAENNSAELAITGKALQLLAADPIMDRLLLRTRIFARVKPDQKVQIVQMHMDKGLITGMCGDGGNDCGALRAAHAGIALSDAEASVVSPFTSKTKSVRSVVDLLTEGRCALTTSFAAYRFYITYGLNWSIVKTINFVYGVRMPITGYLTIDSISSWLVAYAITLALPLPDLLPYRPTTSLFDPQIMLSVLCPWGMWMIVMGGALVMQQEHPDHVDFPAHLTKGCGYWQLGDNWEATVFTTFMVFPLIWSGIVFSLGSKFRRNVFLNPFIWIVWLTIFCIYTAFLLSDVNDATAIFHVASNAFNGRNAESPIWMRYQFPEGCTSEDGFPTLALNRSRAAGWEPNNCAAINLQTSAKKCGPACAKQDPPYGDQTPGMPYSLRSALFGMVLCCMAVMLLWENFLMWYFVKPDPPVQELGALNKLVPAKKQKQESSGVV